MSDSIRRNDGANEEQLSDEILESVAGGAGGTGAPLGTVDARPPIVKYPGGDDGCFPLPLPPELSV